jgi:hypothetical protein
MSKFDVKKIVPWAKKNWIVLALGVVGVASPVAGWWFSNSMRESQLSQFKAEVSKSADALRTQTIKYDKPALYAGAPAVEFTAAPNEVVIEKFRAARAEQAEQAKGLIDEVLKFNQGDRGVLTKDVFPDPKSGDQVGPKNFARQFNGPAQAELLKLVRAGSPIDVAELSRRIADRKRELLGRDLGGDASDESKLTEDQRKAQADDLAKYRLDQLRRNAARFGVYMNASAFKLPEIKDEVVPSTSEMWDWQWQHWIHQDIARAIAKANSSAMDQGIAGSVVKKVELVEVSPSAIATPTQSDPNAPAPAAGAGEFAVDFMVSPSGRKTNSLYDVRTVKVVAVVDSAQLPAFINALAQTNLMTVVDCDLSRVDMSSELRSGHYMGDNHVIRATIIVETVWLRQWTNPNAPADPAAAPAPVPSPGNRPGGGRLPSSG